MNGQNSNNPNGQPQQLAGQLSSSSSTAPSSSNGASSPAPTSSGMVGFQNYQTANQGDATNQLASAANTGVANQGQQAKNSINQATTSFNQQVNSSSLNNADNAVGDVKNIVAAARNVTVPQAAPAANGASAPANPTPASYLDPSQTSRFQDVINAKYTGPSSLLQTGDYQKAAPQIQQAQAVQNETQNAQGREELLRNLFSQNGDYNQGLNKLDAGILNASTDGVKQLQNTAASQGNLQNQLDQAQIGSTTTAQNRAKQIADINSQARDIYSTGKTAEEQGTEQRLQGVLDNWNKLPDYFKNIIKTRAADNQGVLDNSLNQFKTDNNYDNILSQYNTAKTPYDQAVAQLQQAQENARNVGPANTSGGFQSSSQLSDNAYRADQAQRAIDAANQHLAEVQASYNPIASQKDALDAKIADLKNKFNTNAIALNPAEAALLGVNPGQGIYNLGENAIATGVADKSKLISKNEQARQAALASLGGLDNSHLLDTNLMYNDPGKAGTQSALDALNLKGTHDLLDSSEKNFRDSANADDITGYGSKKVSRGNAFGTKTKTYSSTASANAGDLLRAAGYDTSSPIGQGNDASVANAQQLLRSIANNSQSSNNNPDLQDAQNTMSGTVGGAATGAAIGSQFAGVGAIPGAIAGAQLGQYGASGTVDNLQNLTDVLRGFGGQNSVVGQVGTGIQNVRSGVGNAINDLGGNNSVTSGIAGAIGGINSGDMRAAGEAEAHDYAVQDLKNQYQNFLNNQGYDNRFQVADTDNVKNRIGSLQQLLANLDKTNT